MTDQAGEPISNIESWYETERALLFDYLVRMTGDLERSRSEVFDVIQVIKKSQRHQQSANETRSQMYRTARSFCADCWFRSPLKLLDQVYLGTNRQQDLRRIESFLDQLPPADREVTLLRYRYGFSSKEIASIVGKSIQQVQMMINQSVLALRREQADIDMNQIKQFPLFPLVEFETATAAIDEIVERIPWLWQRKLGQIIFWLLLLAAIVAFYIQRPELFEDIPWIQDWLPTK
ncbi:MAG: sigma factor-like helix-turn-helix DNA-binding protein [Oligoflexus sp.]